MSHGHYITKLGNEFDLNVNETNPGEFFCFISNKSVVRITINKSFQTLYCENNLITSLDIPEGFKRVDCENNLITSLTIPSSLNVLRCDLMDEIEEQYKKELNMRIYQKR